jgi:hypothetical protein
MAARLSGVDFQRDVAARSNAAGTGNVYAAVLNSDNYSYKITKTNTAGVTVTLYPKVFWNVQGNGSALTDASSPNIDTVTIIDAGSGYPIVGSGQNFLNSLS